MNTTKICILAAGRGSRLGSLTADLPKSLLPINGHTILQRQLDSLRSRGIVGDRIHIVTGHAAHCFDTCVPDGVHLVFNEHYHDYNNIYSVQLLRDWVTDDMILINGDTVFHERFLDGLLETEPRSALVIDDSKTLAEEEMKTIYDGGYLRRIGKHLPAEKATGEYIGLLRICGDDLSRFFSKVEEMITDGYTDDWYEGALDRIAFDSSLGLVSTGGLPWVEIDTPDDVERAVVITREWDT